MKPKNAQKTTYTNIIRMHMLCQNEKQKQPQKRKKMPTAFLKKENRKLLFFTYMNMDRYITSTRQNPSRSVKIEILFQDKNGSTCKQPELHRSSIQCSRAHTHTQ
jgi:hypothetical protein